MWSEVQEHVFPMIIFIFPVFYKASNDVSNSLCDERHLFSLCSHIFFFFFLLCQSFLPNIISHWKSSSSLPFSLQLTFSTQGYYSVITLADHLWQCFHNMLLCLPPKRSFLFQWCARRSLEADVSFSLQNKDSEDTNRMHFCNCKCNHRQCLFACSRMCLQMREWTNDNETSLSPIRFLLCEMWPQSCEFSTNFFMHKRELVEQTV